MICPFWRQDIRFTHGLYLTLLNKYFTAPMLVFSLAYTNDINLYNNGCSHNFFPAPISINFLVDDVCSLKTIHVRVGTISFVSLMFT